MSFSLVNFFLSQLESQFPTLYHSLSLNDWILLLPVGLLARLLCQPLTFGEQTGCLTPLYDPHFLTLESLGTHILTHSTSASTFVTLDHKQVSLDYARKTLTGTQGFSKTLTTTILSDDLYQDPQSGRFLTYYVIQDSLWAQSGLSFEQEQRNTRVFESILQALDGNERILPGFLDEITLFNDTAVELNSLVELQKKAKGLLSTCYLKLQKLPEQILRAIIYRFLIEHVYEILFFKITQLCQEQDTSMSTLFSELATLDPNGLGLDFDLCFNLEPAIQELKSLPTLRTPYEKLKCITQTMHRLTVPVDPLHGRSKTPQHPAVVSSDSLIPLVLLTLIRSQVMNLYSNLNYIKLFTFEQDLSKGEMGYALLTLEAVLTFAESQKESLSKYVKRLKGLLEVVETGNLSEMQTCARALTEENVDWKQFRTLSGDTVLLLAVKGNMTDVFDWRTALVWSHGCKTKWTHICGMSTVVAQDTDLDVYNIQGSSALHMSVEMGHLEMTKKLLQLNVSKDARNVQKETPVHLAVKRNDLPCLDVFLKAGLEMDVCDVKGNTPLYYAQIPCLNALLDHGAFLNHKNYAGLTPFLYQVQQAQLDTAAHYLTLPDLEIDCKDQGHRNVIHFCAFRGYDALAKKILDLKIVNVNDTTRRGNTALHAAAESGQGSMVRLLLQYGADPVIRNKQGKSAADLSRNDGIKSPLYDYTIFLKQRYFVGDRVAQVVLGTSVTQQFEFILKSGQFPDMESITTVSRSLNDFLFLRNQLAVEYPEAALVELQDLVFSTKPNQSSSRALRKMVKRLNYFVLDLLSHPVFKTHELIWEFLVVPSIQNSVIASRTKLKRDSLLETIQDTYSPIVEAPTGSVEYFKDMHAQLSRLQVATRQAGNCVKRLGHHKKDMSQTMRILRFHLSRPTTEITFESPLIVSEALRQIGDIYMKQSINDTWDMGDFLYDHGPSFQAVLSVLPRYETLLDEYQVLAKQTAALCTSLQKLENQVQSDQSDGAVTRLSETYYQYQCIASQMQAKGSYVNYADTFLVSEMDHFHKYHAKLVNSTIQEYARRQIELEESGIGIMEEALQAISDSNELFQYGRSFSPTNLSFGQGSPMSRGSMMDSLQQDLDSNALQLV